MPSLYPHEVRKIAQGAGAASGFAGFFFPSLRARGLGEEKPVPPYSAMVYKDGNEVRAEDWKGRKIASGEAGVDDASVIQSAINAVEAELAQSSREIIPKIVFRGTFSLKNTIKITKMIHLEGGKFEIQSPLGFEVFDGDKTDWNPQYVGFERMAVVGNGNDAFACRYCGNWYFSAVKMFDVKRGLILERTWGDTQTMIASRIVGNPSDGEGLIHAITPENGCTNSFTIIGSTFWCSNDNAAVFKFEPQAENSAVTNLTFYDVYTEGYGDFFAGLVQGSRFFITQSTMRGNGFLFNLEEGKNLDIQIAGRQGNLYFKALENSKIWIQKIMPKRTDKPLLAIEEGAFNFIEIETAKEAVNSDVDYIQIGASGKWYDAIVIKNSRFWNTIGCRSVISFGNAGRSLGCKVVNCVFRNVNSIPSYPSCYALYYQGKKQIVENCEFWELNKYEVTNNLSGFVFKGIKEGHAKFENSGTATFSGDGSTTQFSIAHDLISEPSKVQVTPMTEDAAGDFYVTKDATNIYVNYLSAPPSGSNNVKLSWYAEV